MRKLRVALKLVEKLGTLLTMQCVCAMQTESKARLPAYLGANWGAAPAARMALPAQAAAAPAAAGETGKKHPIRLVLGTVSGL